MSMWTLMARNFAYVFAGIGVVLLHARMMGVYENQLRKKEKDKTKVTLAVLAVLSTVIGFGIVAIFSLFMRMPEGIKIFSILTMAVIIYIKTRSYIEGLVAQGDKGRR